MVDAIPTDSHFLPAGPRDSVGLGCLFEVEKIFEEPVVLVVVLGGFVDVETLVGAHSQ